MPGLHYANLKIWRRLAGGEGPHTQGSGRTPGRSGIRAGSQRSAPATARACRQQADAVFDECRPSCTHAALRLRAVRVEPTSCHRQGPGGGSARGLPPSRRQPVVDRGHHARLGGNPWRGQPEMVLDAVANERFLPQDREQGRAHSPRLEHQRQISRLFEEVRAGAIDGLTLKGSRACSAALASSITVTVDGATRHPACAAQVSHRR